MTRHPAGPGPATISKRPASAQAKSHAFTPTTTAGEHRYARLFDVVQLLKGPGYCQEDVANTVLFLASEEARFITAEIINIDGGAAAKL